MVQIAATPLGNLRPEWSRFVALIGSTIVLLVAACGPTPPSPAMSQSVVPPSPSTAFTTTSSPAESPACPTEPGATAPREVNVRFKGLTAELSAPFWVYSIVDRELRQHVTDQVVDPGIWDGGLVLGGSSRQLILETADDSRRPVHATELAAMYRAPGADAPEPVRLRDRFSGPDLAIADGDGAAEIDLVATWSDGCFAFTGQSRIAVTVAPAAAVAACQVAMPDVQTYVGRNQAATVDLGQTAQRFDVLSYSARYTQGEAGTDVVWYFGWSPETPVAMGTHAGALVLKVGEGDMQLAGATVEYYDRAAFSVDPPGKLLFRADGVQAADGSVALRLPPVAGRYVVLIGASWDLPCATGTGEVVASVDVR